jgi:hypothetical protein
MIAQPAERTPVPAAERTSALRVVHLAVAVGLVAVVIEAVTLAFMKSTDTGHYRYAADYWLTAAALPHAAAGVVLLPAIRVLQRGRDGRLGRVGIYVNVVSLLALATVCAASLAVAHDVQAGPTYVLGGLGTLIGTALFAAGSWRVGLLPRWLLTIWPIVWIIGSFFAVSASPLLLAIFYIVLLAVLRRRSWGLAEPMDARR